MSMPHHLRIINPCICSDANASFALFSILTTELRLSIWELAMQQQRLVELVLELPSTSENHGKRPTSSNYIAITRNRRLHSKFLRVSRESRKVALRVYRVRIRCYMQTNTMLARSTLYISPENDILYVKGAKHPLEYTFVAFLHDLRACDPRNVGVLHLALGSDVMGQLVHLQPPKSGPSPNSFVHVLSNFHSIIWMVATVRQIMGFWSNHHTAGVRFNHSMPIMSTNASFDLVPCDPRPIDAELRYVATVQYDPRKWSAVWRDFFSKWGVQRNHSVKERVLFAYHPGWWKPEIHDVATANRYLTREESIWMSNQQEKFSTVLRYEGRCPVETPDELARAVRPAIGFWLFPIEALKGSEPCYIYCWPVFDLRGCQPELGLAHVF
jgi:hypothetical protein